ncbi:hypothetical protein V6N13_062014 [Hibiscus sabdariffa]|uniref:Uncharacterized protein n=1 Tax=Hibiscus sabdariffa TaxID=183260 RepID=A0ABR2PFA2_9ROSI
MSLLFSTILHSLTHSLPLLAQSKIKWLVSLSENDNKENIPPFSSKNSTYLLTKPSSSSNPQRRLRKPLQDITNLILPRVYSTLVRSDTTALVTSRAENGVGSTCKKTCLVYKSRNFR